jgi:hypothetical protein
MQRDDRSGEARAKARNQLRRQRDFRHEHERALPGLQHALDEPEVHLGLAAPGDTVQQESAEAPERGADALERRALVRRQYRPRLAGAGRRRWLGPSEGLEPAALGEAAQGACVPGRGDLLVRRAFAADMRNEGLLPRTESRAAGDGVAPALGKSPDDLVARGRRAFAQHLRHRAEEHVAERVVVVVRGPAQESERSVVPELNRVEPLAHRL